jgi:hypothetical protein
MRISTNTLGVWRRKPDHSLKWEIIAGRLVRYRAGNVRAYLSGGPPARSVKVRSCAGHQHPASSVTA